MKSHAPRVFVTSVWFCCRKSVSWLCAFTVSCSPPSSDAPHVSVCPPVALDSGVGLLCRLLELWGQAPGGILALVGWLLGEEEADGGAAAAEEAFNTVGPRQVG